MALDPIELRPQFCTLLAEALRQVPAVQAALVGVLEGRLMDPAQQFDLVIDGAHLEPKNPHEQDQGP